MLSMATPLWLLALPLPWLAWWLGRRRRAASRGASALYHPQAELLARLSRETRGRLPWLWLLGCSLLLLALTRPQWLDDEHQGRNFLLAIDISSSMKAQDFFVDGRAVNRLDAVKYVARNFIEQRRGDRIGLLVFADDAYTLVPLSGDLGLVRHQLDQIDQGMAGQKTALGQAIALGVKRLERQDAHSRNLILLSDGSNTAGDIHPLNALQIAKLKGVKIYTIGVGNPGKVLFQRGPVEQPDYVAVPLDEKLLKQLATETGGHYYNAGNTEALEQIMADIEQQETVPLRQTGSPPVEWYLAPLLAGLLLLGLARWRSNREVLA
jgi:Ca-activated chloride channel family protein